MKIVCLDGYALNPGDLSWDRIEALGELTVHDRTAAAEIVDRAAGAEVLLTNKTPLSADTIAALGDLRYIGVLATGFNIVDVAAARGRDIPVTNVPTYSTDSVAQFVFALTLELCHRVGLHSDAVHAGEWESSPDFTFSKSEQVELAGRVLGVVGAGRIGRRTAEIGRAFGMDVLVYDHRPTKPLPDGARYAELDELFASADVVTLHVPLTPDTEKLVDAARLSGMKSSAFLVNTSRGPVIDEAALAKALHAGTIAGAAVDVLSAEPPPAGHPLVGVSNCIITPHIAWTTTAARRRLMNTVADNLAAWQKGEPINVVNP